LADLSKIAPASPAPTATLDPAMMSAEELLAHYKNKSLSPLEALLAVTERIAAENPTINAFAAMNPQALQAARASTVRWAAGTPEGVLDGVPVTIKDLIDISGLPTRRGSLLTSADPVTVDAPITTALKAAGAVIIGKTTTTEYGWKTPSDNPLHGSTKNPWHPAHSAGGSSSGAAAAAGAGFGPLHVGTDAGGSIRIPAAWCGVVGLKPSFGRVPQWPLGAFGHVACAGPITRTVRDAALLLTILARFDVRDPFSLPENPRDWRTGIEDGVDGMKIAILPSPGFNAPVDQDGHDALHIACRVLEEAGAGIDIAHVKLPDCSEIFPRIWGAALSRLVETIPLGRRHQLDPGLMDVACRFQDVTALDMLEAEAQRVQAAHAMAMLHQTFDAVICPTVPHCAPRLTAKPTDPVHALWNDWAPWTFLFNLTRQPAISVPVGVTAAGLPRAVQLATALYRDNHLLRIARTLERAL
jgi:aspartyl-tRNA(Asn)/glutamyl-tRNA(Gln) amidotransferase subunit A